MNQKLANQQQVNILLVDDHSENLLALRAILQRPDYHLVSAISGPEALKSILKYEFAVILLDVMMPGMNGYEVASIIKDRESNRLTPIIFLTAIAKDVDHIFKGYSVGAVDYLLKPLAAEVVKAKVEVFVQLYKQAQEIKRQGELLAESERREKEYRLAELKLTEERRFRLLADSIPEIIWSANANGVIVYCNQRWIEYTGLPLQELAKFGWEKAIHPEDRQRVIARSQESIHSGNMFDAEFRLLRARDQVYRWHLARAVPLRDAKNEVVEWFGVTTDIETQKKSEIALQETLRARDEFFSITSHELKTPVTSLKLELQLLDRNMKKKPQEVVPTSEVRERLSTAMRQTGRLEKLIENLLDVSRIRTGRLGIEREKFDFSSVVKDVVSRQQEQARASGSAITVSSEKSIEGYFDRTRIEQVVTNLISNAIKYGERKPIEVAVHTDDHNLILTVQDHGIGISKEDQVRIFGQFERAVSSRDFSGLGLGLYITKEIIQAHGGSIEIQSELNQGALFTVRLPRKISPITVEDEASEESQWAQEREKKSS